MDNYEEQNISLFVSSLFFQHNLWFLNLTWSLTFDLKNNTFPHQDFSLAAVNIAGPGSSVSICRVFQGQTEVASFQWVFLHLCLASVKSMSFRLIGIILRHMDLIIVPVHPNHFGICRKANYGFAGQQNRLIPWFHLHVVDWQDKITKHNISSNPDVTAISH